MNCISCQQQYKEQPSYHEGGYIFYYCKNNCGNIHYCPKKGFIYYIILLHGCEIMANSSGTYLHFGTGSWIFLSPSLMAPKEFTYKSFKKLLDKLKVLSRFQ